MNEEPKKHIKQAGLKITAPRVVILDIFTQEQGKHLSAEDVYQLLQNKGYDFSLATVYRVLTQFEESGLIHKHRFEEEKSVYEIATDSHHDHLVCMKCGKIEEFIEEVIERQQELIAEQHGFQMTDHSLSIYGLCPDCK